MSELIAEGDYEARMVDWGISETRDGGEQFVINFEVDGHRVTWFGSFDPLPYQDRGAPAEWTVQALRNCGWEGDDLANVTFSREIARIAIKHKVGRDGKTRAQVSIYGSMRTVDPMRAKAVSARMQGIIAAVDAKLGRPTSTASVGAVRRPAQPAAQRPAQPARVQAPVHYDDEEEADLDQLPF